MAGLEGRMTYGETLSRCDVARATSEVEKRPTKLQAAEARRDRMMELHGAGLTPASIAAEVGLTSQTVRRFLIREGLIKVETKPGRIAIRPLEAIATNEEREFALNAQLSNIAFVAALDRYFAQRSQA
jgi:predicted transcriptional regulator